MSFRTDCMDTAWTRIVLKPHLSKVSSHDSLTKSRRMIMAHANQWGTKGFTRDDPRWLWFDGKIRQAQSFGWFGRKLVILFGRPSIVTCTSLKMAEKEDTCLMGWETWKSTLASWKVHRWTFRSSSIFFASQWPGEARACADLVRLCYRENAEDTWHILANPGKSWQMATIPMARVWQWPTWWLCLGKVKIWLWPASVMQFSQVSQTHWNPVDLGSCFRSFFLCSQEFLCAADGSGSCRSIKSEGSILSGATDPSCPFHSCDAWIVCNCRRLFKAYQQRVGF